MNENQHLKNFSEIRDFLEENQIKYTFRDGSFCLWDHMPERRNYEINYVISKDFPISYPKHGVEGVRKDHFYALSRNAENQNSFKLWINDFEWENDRQREVLKSYILHEAGKTPTSFYARDCEVCVIESFEGRRFEEENCFYGKRGASLSLGLRLKKDIKGHKAGKLVMLYTFGLNFFGKQPGLIEVLRAGTLKFCNVVGGASKLLSHFINNYKTINIGKKEVEVKSIKYYSDYAHNNGKSLEKTGFTFLGYSGGGFVNLWLEENKILHRSPSKHKWVMQQMAEGKVLAIPNSGTKNYIINLP